jgi:hypothetical protein
MSGGYTPIFRSVLDGTLYGRWPHTGIWVCLLSQCDWQGNIDMVPRLLASKIGVAEDVLMQCIADFMAPDPGSRTGDLEGRRLELIDPTNRQWGWRVINHGIYREKARKAAFDAARVADGRNKARMAARKENAENTGNSLDPRTPAMTRSQTQTQTQTETQTLRRGEDARRGEPTEATNPSPDAPRGAPKIGNGTKQQTREEKIRLARIGLEKGFDAETIRKQYGLTIEELEQE